MKSRSIILTLIGCLFLISLSAFNNIPEADPAPIAPHGLNTPADPEWYDVINAAAQTVGVNNLGNWIDFGETGYDDPALSAMAEDFPVENHDAVFMIGKFSWYEAYRRGEEDKYTDVDFHGLDATLQNDNLDTNIHNGYCLFWQMNGLYYGVCHTCIHEYKVGSGYIYQLADALYYAAGGAGAPAAPPPSQPEESPPDDLCAGVTCPSEYCSEDDTQYLYDCFCDPELGGCSCLYNDCTQGCDAAQGGCLGVQEGLCAGVDCGPDYCLEDGETRMYDCSCDPTDGFCYCYSEICDAGCNMATGKCVVSMVIDDGSGGEDNYIDDDLSDELLDVLGVLGGAAAAGGVAIGGGVLGIKAIKGMLAKRALSQGSKMVGAKAVEAAEPSLSELIAKAEQSADRTLKSIESAEKAVRADQLRYREMLKRNIKFDGQWADTLSKQAALIEKAEFGVRVLKKGADIGADLIGNVPGGGQLFKYGYNMTTAGVESAASGDSLGAAALESLKKGVETGAGDLLMPEISYLKKIPDGAMKMSVKQVIKKTGAKNLFSEAVKNEGFNKIMNGVKKVKSVGKSIDRRIPGKVIKRVLYR